MFLSLCSISQASGASLFPSPSSGSYKINQSFAVSVFVSSKDQAMNAASGVISFPSDKLEVISISKSGSIISLWVQEPSFSNAVGAVNFEGIVFNPGYTGSSGKIISINFKAKSAGEAAVGFSSGSILANDGDGTNITSGLGGAKYIIDTSIIVEPVAPTPKTNTPSAPTVNSSTHPDQDKWYSNNNPELSWSIAGDITGVSFLLDDKPISDPGSVSDGLVTKKIFEGVEDGVNYFHIKLKNKNGWGGVSHYSLNIDTENPKNLSIEVLPAEDILKEGIKIKMIADDDISGISYFELKIDNAKEFNLPYNEENIYELPLIDSGKHVIIFRAFDFAGNSIMDFKEINIDLLEEPRIKEYSSNLQSDNFFVIKGETYPKSSVTIWIQKENEMPMSYELRSDENGNFMYVSEKKMEAGRYKFWTAVVNDFGLQSKKSDEIFILVEESSIVKMKAVMQNLIIISSILINLILLIIIFLSYMIRKIKQRRKRARKEINEAEESLAKAFRALREDIGEQLDSLDKTGSRRELAKKEVEKKIENNLKIAEKFVEKEIEDIRKEV